MPRSREDVQDNLATRPREQDRAPVAVEASARLNAATIGLLQRSAGNAAVARLLQRAPTHPQAPEPVRYTVQTHTHAAAEPHLDGSSPDIDSAPHSEYFIPAGMDVELLGTDGDRLLIEGDLHRMAADPSHPPELVTTGEAWIDRAATNLVPSPDAAVENDRFAQDLDDMLDEFVIPALARWRIGVRTQGTAYLRAFETFNQTLEAATQQAKARADFFAAALTAVSVGALGWIGDAVVSGADLSDLLSEAVRGSLEDALQSAVGEAIDLGQGGWFTAHVSRETHPLRYQNAALNNLDAVEEELHRFVGAAKATIRRSAAAVDRASALAQMYGWWSNAVARQAPDTDASSEEAMAKAFEIMFWRRYILDDLTDEAYYLFFGPGMAYEHPEAAVRQRLDELGISRDAGVHTWMEWWEVSQVLFADYETDGEREYRYLGSDDTQKLAVWARAYTPATVFD